MPSSLNLALRLFTAQLENWKPAELMKAIDTNYSIADNLKRHRGKELAGWQAMATAAKMLDNTGFDSFLNQITYGTVLQSIQRTRPEFALILQNNPRGRSWLEGQISSVKELIFA